MAVVISRQGYEFGQCVVCREGNLKRFVARSCLREHCEDVSLNGTLIAEREVKAQIEIVGYCTCTTAAARGIGVFGFIFVAAAFLSRICRTSFCSATFGTARGRE